MYILFILLYILYVIYSIYNIYSIYILIILRVQKILNTLCRISLYVSDEEHRVILILSALFLPDIMSQ
jgi:hypothetical protein